MPQQTKIFRVFVSSTFTDMKLERSILQRDAFPRLEKFCEENGAKFQAVDLRWGVNEESSLNQKTLQICFNEIARCQKISPKPNFLILLGDKYGWKPIPEIIPENEMHAIKGQIPELMHELIDFWYRRDENAIPPEYVLQPKGDELKEYTAWGPIEMELQTVLRAAVNKLHFTPEQRIKYIASATHQEIIRGALNPPVISECPEKHVFAFSRTINGLPADKSAEGFIDLIGEQPDKESEANLIDLKAELKDRLGNEHFKNYDGVWKNGTLHFDEKELQKFNDDVYYKLERTIVEQLTLITDKDEIVHEVKLHEEFKEILTEHFQGRETILKDIRNYLGNSSETKVLLVIGESGSGKSSVMAQTIKLIEEKNEFVFYRFIGTTTGSSNLIPLLRSICGQITRHYDVKLETITGESGEGFNYNLTKWTEILMKCLELATSEKPILLFLDALDQLSDTDNANSFLWIPKELPEHVRIVVSSITEFEKLLAGNQIIYLPVLPETDAKKILDLWLKVIKRKLTPDQYNLVINRFNKTPLAIYLKLAFEKAKHWHSYDKQHSLKEDVPGIIKDYFHDLENEHTEDLVRNVICYMLCGRYEGLAEKEILEILVFDKEYWRIFCEKSHIEHRKELEEAGKMPIVVWSRLFLDLEPFLTEREFDGMPVITFFHRQLVEVAREKYSNENHIIYSHRNLGSYFKTKPLYFDLNNQVSQVSRLDQKPNLRKLDEQCWQWFMSGDEQGLLDSVLEISQISLFIALGRSDEIIEYWTGLNKRYPICESYRIPLEKFGLEKIDPEEYAGGLNAVGLLFKVFHHSGEAAGLLHNALKRLESAESYMNPVTAGSYGNLGVLLSEEGRYEEAEQAFLSQIMILSNIAPGDLLLMRPRNNLTSFYLAWGKLEKAESACEEAIGILMNNITTPGSGTKEIDLVLQDSEELLGLSDIWKNELVTAIFNRGKIFARKDNIPSAIIWGIRGANIARTCQDLSPTTHTQYLYDLGNWYFILRDYENSELILMEAVSVLNKKGLSDNALGLSLSGAQLIRLWLRMGKNDQIESTLTVLKKSVLQITSNKESFILKVLCTLADELNTYGMILAAEEIYCLAAHTGRTNFIDQIHDNILVLNQLSYFYHSRKKFVLARDNAQEAVALAQNSGDKYVLFLQQKNLTIALLDLGELFEAETSANETLNTARLACSDPPTLANAESVLGDILAQQHKYNEAIAIFLHVFAILESIKPQPIADLDRFAVKLANLYENIRSQDNELLWYKRSIELKSLYLSTNDPRWQTPLNNYAFILSGLNRNNEALSVYERLLTLQRMILPQPHTDIAKSLSLLGLTHFKMQNMIMALKYFKQALQIRQTLSEDNQQTRELIQTIAFIESFPLDQTTSN